MKLYKKSELKVVEGYIIDENNEVVTIPSEIVEQYVELDKRVQEAVFILDQPRTQEAPTLEGFELHEPFAAKVEVGGSLGELLKYKEKEAMALVDALEAQDDTKELNDLIDIYKPLMFWCEKEYIPDANAEAYDFSYQVIMPLCEMKGKDVAQYVEILHKAKKHIEGKEANISFREMTQIEEDKEIRAEDYEDSDTEE
jgi:hypothetical protein